MQILGKTRFDFLGKQPFAFALSVILLVTAVWSLSGAVVGLIVGVITALFQPSAW